MSNQQKEQYVATKYSGQNISNLKDTLLSGIFSLSSGADWDTVSFLLNGKSALY